MKGSGHPTGAPYYVSLSKVPLYSPHWAPGAFETSRVTAL